MRNFFIFFCILFSEQLFSKENVLDPNKILNEAQTHFLKGELFNSYRLYLAVEEVSQTPFTKSDYESYITTASILLSKDHFNNFCKRLTEIPTLKTEKIISCSKIFIKRGEFNTALTFLERIPPNQDSVDSLILKSSVYFNQGKKEKCLGLSDRADKIENKNLDDKELIRATSGRCSLLVANHKQAIEKLNSLRASSDYYFSTLYEQAWAQFKLRDLETARDLIQILTSLYDMNLTSRSPISLMDDNYFNGRYLLGYIELTNNNPEKSKKILANLALDLEKYKSKNSFKQSDMINLFKQLRELDSIAKISNSQFKMLDRIRNYILNWGHYYAVSQIDEGVRYIVALNKEISRTALIDGELFRNYNNKLKHIKKSIVQNMAQETYESVKSSEQNVESLIFKSKMGQLENYWAQRTEGRRTLADVIEDYKFGIQQVENYLGKK